MLLLLACMRPPADEALDAKAVSIAAADPAAAFVLCKQIGSGNAAAECAWVVAEAASADHADAAVAICDELGPLAQSECLFRVAQASADPRLCQRIPDLADPCRTHVAHEILDQLQGPDRLPGQFESIVLERLAPHPLEHGEWADLYDHAMRWVPELSLSTCDAASFPELCREAVHVVFVDKLGSVIREQELACSGPVPSFVADIQDPVFDALVATAREEGRCVR